MEKADIEPLEPRLWLARLHHLSDMLSENDSAGLERHFRLAYHLLHLAPSEEKDHLSGLPNETTMETWLECGAYETAILNMLGTECAFRAERHPGKAEIRIEVALPGASLPGEGRSVSFASAMLAGWVDCLSRSAAQRHSSPSRRDLRKYRSARRRNSTEH